LSGYGLPGFGGGNSSTFGFGLPSSSTGSSNGAPVSYGGATQTGGNGPFQGAQNSIGSLLGLNPTYNTIHGDYYDPLDLSGQQMRGSIYGVLSGLSPSINQNSTMTANALRMAAGNPGFGQAADLAGSEIGGDYLNGSPALDNAMAAMRAASGAQTANTNAGIRSQFAQNGMSFGTANQESQMANEAANNASANQAEAQARLQNYQAERQLQNNAVNTLGTATSTPLSYLSQQNEAYLTPLTEIGQLVRGLSAGGTVNNPDTVVDKGLLNNLTSAIGNI
jgi:hypothetical protein